MKEKMKKKISIRIYYKIISMVLCLGMVLSIIPAQLITVNAEETSTFEYKKEDLPTPILDGHEDWIELYDKVWEIAAEQIRYGTTENGFVDEYIDSSPGFANQFYQWDSAFITQFGKYSNGVFPSMVALENLYRKQDSDGYIGKSYYVSNGASVYVKSNVESRNPPLFAWVEWENYLMTGDASRFTKEITANGTDDSTKTIYQRLIDYHYWIKDNNRYENGFYWTSTRGSGMTGTPRLGCMGNADTGDGSWVDLAGQMALSAKYIKNIAEVLGDTNNVDRFQKEYDDLAYLLNTFMWDETDGFYYDLDQNGDFYKLKTPASYWPVLAGVASAGQVQRMSEYLLDPDVFNRLHMLPSVDASSDVYDASYKWRGDVWPPMTYLVVEALNNYGRSEEAKLISENHIENLSELYATDATLYERMNADALLPSSDGTGAATAKSDFIGWTGLGPVTMLLESAIGIIPDGAANTITWNLSQTSRNGIENLDFGKNKVSLVADARDNKANKAAIHITAQEPFTLNVVIDGESYTVDVASGENSYTVGSEELPAENNSINLFNVAADTNIYMVSQTEIGGGYCAFQNEERKYYAVDSNQEVTASNESLTRAAKFQVCQINGDIDAVVLRSMENGKYVVYEGGKLIANGDSTSAEAAQFRLLPSSLVTAENTELSVGLLAGTVSADPATGDISVNAATGEIFASYISELPETINYTTHGTTDWFHLGGNNDTTPVSATKQADMEAFDYHQVNKDNSTENLTFTTIGEFNRIRNINSALPLTSLNWSDGEEPYGAEENIKTAVNWRMKTNGGDPAGYAVEGTIPAGETLTILMGEYKAESNIQVFVQDEDGNYPEEPALYQELSTEEELYNCVTVTNDKDTAVQVKVVHLETASLSLDGSGNPSNSGNIILIGALIGKDLYEAVPGENIFARFVSNMPKNINYTTSGTTDWLHAERDNASFKSATASTKAAMDSFDYKTVSKNNEVENITFAPIGEFSRIKNINTAKLSLSWSDGEEPYAAAQGVTTGVNWKMAVDENGVPGEPAGYQVEGTIPAGETLSVLIGQYRIVSNIQIFVQDRFGNYVEEPIFTQELTTTSELYNCVTVTNDNSTPVNVKVVHLETSPIQDNGNIIFIGALIGKDISGTIPDVVESDNLTRLKNFVTLVNPLRYVESARGEFSNAVAGAESTLALDYNGNETKYRQSFRTLQISYSELSKSDNIIPVIKTETRRKVEAAKEHFAQAISAGEFSNEQLLTFSAAIDAADYDICRNRYATNEDLADATANLIAADLIGSNQKAVRYQAFNIGEDETKRKVVWFAESTEPSAVQLVEKPAEYNAKDSFPTENVQSFPATPYEVTEPEFTGNKATISDLKANTEYLYRVGNEEGWSGTYQFKTGDFDDGAFSFLVAGDAQIGGNNTSIGVDAKRDGRAWNAALTYTTNRFPEISFINSVGDQVQGYTKEEINEQYYLFLLPDVLRTYPLATSVGSTHDVSIEYSEHFFMPNVSELGAIEIAGPESGNYWFEQDGVLFMNLNMVNGQTNTEADPNIEEHVQFMQETIAKCPDAEWKIVTFHHSIFSVGTHSTKAVMAELRNKLAPVFSELGIDVVFMGHDHGYVRTYMMDGISPVVPAGNNTNSGQPAASSVQMPEESEVLYITASSSSGSKFYGEVTASRDYVAVKNTEERSGIAKIDVSDEYLQVTTYFTDDEDMPIMDTFAINRMETDTVNPVISFPEETLRLPLKASFETLKGVSAVDNFNGNLTDSIQVSGDVDTTKAGTYQLTYTVTDQANNTGTAVRTIIVYDTKPTDPSDPTDPTDPTEPTDPSKPVISISLDKTAHTLNKGESYTLKVTYNPSAANEKTVTWKSSDNSVASVNGGKVAALKGGKATITARTANGKEASCIITVTEKSKHVAVSKLSFKASKKTIIAGKTYTQKATVAPANATNKKVTYKSSNKKTATVNKSSGKVKAVAAGTATITATAADGSKKTAKYTITVKPKTVSLSSVKSSKKGTVVVKWKKLSKVTGYQVYMSTKSSTKGFKKVKTISKASTVKYTRGNLTSKKTVYFKVRAYKKSGSTTIYGNFSKVRKVKVK